MISSVSLFGGASKYLYQHVQEKYIVTVCEREVANGTNGLFVQ